METTRIFGLCGSLRRGSYNMAILQAARDLAPRGVEFTIFDQLGEIPPYNQDDEKRLPAAVIDLKAAVRAADAIVIATPEYNHSVPGVLKNALDWGSRPHGDNAWEGKPVAVMGASTSLLGTVRAQGHLRQSFVFLDMYPVNRPEVMVASAPDRISDDGVVTDATTRKLIAELMAKLVEWAARLRATAPVAAGAH